MMRMGVCVLCWSLALKHNNKLTSPDAVQYPVVHCLLSMWLNCDVMYSMRHHFDLDDVIVLRSTFPYCYRFREDKLNEEYFSKQILNWDDFFWYVTWQWYDENFLFLSNYLTGNYNVNTHNVLLDSEDACVSTNLEYLLGVECY